MLRRLLAFKNRGKIAVGTVAAKNFLSHARVLAKTLRKSHPELPLFVALADEVDGYFDPAREPLRLVRLEDLAIPNLPGFRFQYERKPLAIATKPFLMRYLLDQGFGAVVYLDPDILVLNTLEPLLGEARRHSICLTPHFLSPLTASDRRERELNILQSGTYNGGCLSVRSTPVGRRFLAWWQERVYRHCREALSEGLYYDQRWLDLAPVFFEDVRVLRDPGINVGHWALPERQFRLKGNVVRVDGQPCRLFHFSGYDPDQPDAVTKYAKRITLSDIGECAALFDRYRRLLEAAGYQESRGWPYAYGHFDNGVPIPDLVRRIFNELCEDAARFGDPNEATRSDSFFHWLREPIDSNRELPINRLGYAIYAKWADTELLAPEFLNTHRRSFYEWLHAAGREEYGLPDALLELR